MFRVVVPLGKYIVPKYIFHSVYWITCIVTKYATLISFLTKKHKKLGIYKKVLTWCFPIYNNFTSDTKASGSSF